MKYLFFNDYSEGAHPRIMEALAATNDTQEIGYGEDSISLEAAKLIKKQMGDVDVDVHFVSGGTQANLIALASMLRPYESVIAASSAHINVHEAGAIEATGHRISAVQGVDGKLTSELIEKVVREHTDEHMVKPKVVFVSQSTEIGTIYSKQELQKISAACKNNDLYLYLDGARLGSALMAKQADLTLSDIAELVDMFYIGGTKNGALLGEAIVIVNPDLKQNFKYHLKQRGALLAKGRVLGVQFRELFKDNLYFDLAGHANEMAQLLTKGIKDCGYSFQSDPVTNQIFPILPNKVIEALQKEYGFYVWSKVDTNTACIRLVTSWATPKEAVEELIESLKRH